MIDWRDLHYFAALADAGSLSAAARQIGVEHATISRRVAALEQDMGLKLVDRRGRRLKLTEEGEKIAAVARRMNEEALAIGRVKAASSSLIAEVTVSAPPAYANFALVAPLARLSRSHPGLKIRLIGEKRYASLDSREADIAVRLGRPEKGDFAIRMIGTLPFALYATADYLAENQPEDWTFIAYDESMNDAPQQVWLKGFAAGREIGIRASSLEAQAHFAGLGAGIACLPEFAARPHTDLVAISTTDQPMAREIWLVTHNDVRNVPAIRAVADALAAHRSDLKD
jgi:DNA-binding transcriptional LysR family regulator